MKIGFRNLPVGRIDAATTREMHELFVKYYTDIHYDQFCADLREKTSCIFIYLPGDGDHKTAIPGRIMGFSTISLRRERRPFGATYLFSGDTVLDRSIWGKSILQRAFFWAILKEKLRAPWRPLYWMLISKGYITYLMMVRNFPSSFPRWDRPTPRHLDRRMTAYYQDRYGDAFDRQSGVISFNEAHGSVRGDLAVPKGAVAEDPDVRFFLRCNPRYSEGHELCCIAEIRIRDFLLHFTTAFRRRRRHRRVQRRAELRRKSSYPT